MDQDINKIARRFFLRAYCQDWRILAEDEAAMLEDAASLLSPGEAASLANAMREMADTACPEEIVGILSTDWRCQTRPLAAPDNRHASVSDLLAFMAEALEARCARG